jgi:aryl-alcohol dehydrogenase-like predicted oxidoreductase
VRLQVRSALLQGLLAASSSHALSQHPDVQAWFAYCADTGRNPISAALAHVRDLPWCDDVVVGVTSADELRDIVAAWQSLEPQLAPVTLATQNLALIDPRRWNSLAT